MSLFENISLISCVVNRTGSEFDLSYEDKDGNKSITLSCIVGIRFIALDRILLMSVMPFGRIPFCVVTRKWGETSPKKIRRSNLFPPYAKRITSTCNSSAAKGPLLEEMLVEYNDVDVDLYHRTSRLRGSARSKHYPSNLRLLKGSVPSFRTSTKKGSM